MRTSLLLFLLLPLAAWGEANSSSAREALLGSRWKWFLNGELKGEATFQANGSVRNPGHGNRAVFQWKEIGPHNFTLRAGQKSSVLQLKADYSGFEGSGLEPSNRIRGERVNGNVSETSPDPAPRPEPATGPSALKLFADQGSHAKGWVITPLATEVPASVFQSMQNLQSALRQEGVTAHAQLIPAYRHAQLLCDQLLGALMARGELLARNRRLNGGKLSPQWENDWMARLAPLETAWAQTYPQFQDLLRQNPPPASSSVTLAALAIGFPPAPPKADRPVAPRSALGLGPNPLDRGAYNRQRVMRGNGWTRYR